jgi:hypothetical protein
MTISDYTTCTYAHCYALIIISCIRVRTGHVLVAESYRARILSCCVGTNEWTKKNRHARLRRATRAITGW